MKRTNFVMDMLNHMPNSQVGPPPNGHIIREVWQIVDRTCGRKDRHHEGFVALSMHAIASRRADSAPVSVIGSVVRHKQEQADGRDFYTRAHKKR
jgi:hypothetical protein